MQQVGTSQKPPAAVAQCVAQKWADKSQQQVVSQNTLANNQAVDVYVPQPATADRRRGHRTPGSIGSELVGRQSGNRRHSGLPVKPRPCGGALARALDDANKSPASFRQRGFFYDADVDQFDDACVDAWLSLTFERAFNESRYASISACAYTCAICCRAPARRSGAIVAGFSTELTR